MEKREWIFLGFLGSIIGLLVWLLVNVAFGTYSVTTPLSAFVYSLAYFITWSTVTNSKVPSSIHARVFCCRLLKLQT